jgi:hypothetical protein
MIRLKATLNRLDYRKDMSPWAVAQKEVRVGGAFLLVLSGFISLEANGTSVPASEISVPFELFSMQNSVVGQYLKIHRRPIDNQALCVTNISKIRLWLKDCNENHVKCFSSSDINNDNFLPTRLIDVCGVGQSYRLVETSKLSNSKKQKAMTYLALSYCWGSPSAPPMTTTHETLQARLEGLPSEAIPQVFMDTILVARALSVQYIWIDSLCIVQNDLNDWQTESGRMADIFSNAYLTVIAATSSSSYESFLHREEQPLFCSIPFRSERHSYINGDFDIRYRPGKKWWGTDKMAEISEHRWLDRGWTFQEERLAKRVLIFGENKFFFDCKSRERAEDMELCRPRPPWTETIHGGLHIGSAGYTQSPYLRNFLHWQTLCIHYVKRKLTFAGDKLPALSGIASKIAKKTESDYLAGLWRGYLMHDLFWQTLGPMKKPNNYRAPSWSWASIDGEIAWKTWQDCHEAKCKMHCILLEAQTTPVGLDKFGGVKDGFLKLSGGVPEVEISWAGGDRHPRHPWRLHSGGYELATADIDGDRREPGSRSARRKCWAILVATCTDEASPPRGFLLTRVGNQRDGVEEYQRVGIFRVFPDVFQDMDRIVHFWEQLPRQTILIV